MRGTKSARITWQYTWAAHGLIKTYKTIKAYVHLKTINPKLHKCVYNSQNVLNYFAKAFNATQLYMKHHHHTWMCMEHKFVIVQ